MNKVALQSAVVGSFYSRDGYLVHLEDERWELSKDVTIPVATLSPFLNEHDHSFRLVLAFYARTASPWHTQNIFYRVLHYCQQLHGAELFSVASLISYRSSLTKQTSWYLGVVRGALRQWSKLGYEGVSGDVIALLDKWVIKGNEKGFAVQSMCPEDGPLTDVELQGVVAGVIDAFADGSLSLSDTCIAMILAMTGRRSGQIAAMKLKDVSPSGHGGYWINFPRAKQRNMGWRSSFNRFAIVEDLWMLLKLQREAVTERFSEATGDRITDQVKQELPLFPASYSLDMDDLLSDRLHIPSREMYEAMRRVASTIQVFSERTGGPLSLNPTRFRYTLGTSLAREGRGEYVIAEALDHSDTQNAGVYVKNIPDIVERIDKAVALQLAPYAQAFRGVLVESEDKALRGNDPASRISNGRNNVGSCGSFGFCGALAPFACYTCAHFQPWLDGPHEQVLEALIGDRDELRNTTDMRIASTNDRLILAVGDVINRCQQARSAM